MLAGAISKKKRVGLNGVLLLFDRSNFRGGRADPSGIGSLTSLSAGTGRERLFRYPETSAASRGQIPNYLASAAVAAASTSPSSLMNIHRPRAVLTFSGDVGGRSGG